MVNMLVYHEHRDEDHEPTPWESQRVWSLHSWFSRWTQDYRQLLHINSTSEVSFRISGAMAAEKASQRRRP